LEELEEGYGNHEKRLEWRDRNEAWWEEALGSSKLVANAI